MSRRPSAAHLDVMTDQTPGPTRPHPNRLIILVLSLALCFVAACAVMAYSFRTKAFEISAEETARAVARSVTEDAASHETDPATYLSQHPAFTVEVPEWTTTVASISESGDVEICSRSDKNGIPFNNEPTDWKCVPLTDPNAAPDTRDRVDGMELAKP